MPVLGPISRRDLIRCLRDLGFDGPYGGGKHQYMVKYQLKLALPNPHQGEITRELLIRILRQAGIEKSDWEKL